MELNKQIRQNFLKVLVASLVEPLQLVTLGFGLMMTVFLPSSSLLILILSLSTVAIRAIMMIGDDSFIKKTLSQTSSGIDFLSGLISQVNQRSKEVRFSSAVEQDLQATKAVLQKLLQSWQTLSDQQVAEHTGIIRDLVQKLVHKLLDLSKQEESVLKFLKQFNESSLDKDLTTLIGQLNSVSDSIAKEEYQKALKLKQNQKASLQKIKNNLERIDSYNARIIAELENTQTYLARLGVSSSGNFDYGETDYLSASLQKLADDIDTFESVNLEVGREVNKMVQGDIEGQKN